MSRNALVLLALAVLSVVLEGAGPPVATASERWRRPLPGGAVIGTFTFERAAPYMRGRRRGIDLAGRPGAPVLAACRGVVTHAGRVPGFGRGVTLRCGALVATELGLSALAVARGGQVAAGRPIGRLAAGGVLRLGARAAGERQGYRDPLALLGEEPAPPAAPPATSRPTRRPPRTGPAPAPVPAARGASPSRTRPPWSVVAGLALLCGGLATGSATHARRRRRHGARTALAQR